MLSQGFRRFGFIMFQVILKSITVESGFHKTPSNTVAVVGQMMKMQCWTNPDETTQWFFSHHGERSFVYNGKAVSTIFTPRFSVNRSTGIGHHDLTAKDVIMIDAGIYECVVLSRDAQGGVTPVSATAELIVLESEPVCSANISTKDGSIKEFDYVEFSCAVNVSIGHWIPSMSWSEGESTSSEEPIVTYSNVSHGLQHLSSITILQVSAEMNDILISCKTQFRETLKKLHYTNATNVPKYLFHWNTTLNVHFGARNVTITPRLERYRLEDVINCSAAGNPSPSYMWKNTRTQETIADGPQLALKRTRIDANQRYTFECIAQNHVAGEVKLSSAYVDIIVPGFWQMPYIIGAGVGIFCTLVAVFILKWIQTKVTSRKCRDTCNVDSTNENPQNQSPDYDSIPEAEVNEPPAISTAQETDAVTETVSDVYMYSALTERPVVVHPPIVYSSLEANNINTVVLPMTVSKELPVYVNIENE